MMIDKCLIQTVPESKRYIALNVALQWCALGANIVMMIDIGFFLQQLLRRTVDKISVTVLACISMSHMYPFFMYHGRFSYELSVFKTGEKGSAQ